MDVLASALHPHANNVVHVFDGVKESVRLNPLELADAYALKTLYDYLVANGVDTAFSVTNFSFLKGLPQCDVVNYLNLGTLSDVSEQRCGVSIDISVLKNCVMPMTKEQKDELKRQYGLDSGKPVLVVGFARPCSALADLVDAALPHAEIVLVGEDFRAPRRVRVVSERGVLKNYYAAADAAVCADNLEHSSGRLHNFVEATEGGPLFMVEPGNKAQYGYRQLAEAGVIRESSCTEALLRRLTAYLKAPVDNSEHERKRREHLMATRAKYLPAILGLIRNLMQGKTSKKCADLRVIVKSDDPVSMRLLHPDSDWNPINLDLLEKAEHLYKKKFSSEVSDLSSIISSNYLKISDKKFSKNISLSEESKLMPEYHSLSDIIKKDSLCDLKIKKGKSANNINEYLNNILNEYSITPYNLYNKSKILHEISKSAFSA